MRRFVRRAIALMPILLGVAFVLFWLAFLIWIAGHLIHLW